MTPSNIQLAAQAYQSQPVQVVQETIRSVQVVEALERQLQSESAIETEQVQACQLEPGDRVLYQNRLMRVGSIQASTTRRYGFFVSLLPADYCNPYTDYKRWQSYHQQHRLEVPSNWFTPWQRVISELETVALPHNPFKDESKALTAPQTEEPEEAGVCTCHSIKVVQISPTRFHCEDSDIDQGCVVWIERGEFHAPTALWPELAHRAIAAVKSHLEENPLFLEYNRYQCCYCVYRNDEGGRYIGSTYGTTTAEALLNTDQVIQKVREGVLEKFGI